MNTATYVSSDEILSVVLPMVDDTELIVAPKGFYMSFIQKAIEKLALDTFFQEARHDEDFPIDTLSMTLPKGCFNVKNIYIYSGDECNITTSHKVYWKRNYYTKGNGYIANDKGNNSNDPFFGTRSLKGQDKSLIRESGGGVNERLFYNIQMGNLMFSASCAKAGNKVHIHYNGTGCDIGEAPIIPIYLRTAIEDYVIESVLRMRMAKDVVRWANLWKIYENRLNHPYNGSWQDAEYKVKSMNSSQREELSMYLGRGAWLPGL